MLYADGEQYNDYLENALHRCCKEKEELINVLNPKHPNFGQIVLVSKKDLDALQARVDELLEANNKEVKKRRSITTVNNIIQKIQQIDEMDWVHGGSCGDGSFDYNQRKLDHIDREAAIRVLKSL